MELSSLRFFVAAAEEGSFTRAAAQLGVSQPSMSQSLRRLELELSTTLFHRVGRGVVLSSSGELLLLSARKILAELDHAQESMGLLKGLKRGRIKFAAPPGLTLDPGVSIIADFRRRYPGVLISVTPSENGLEAMQEVATANADVALTDRAEAMSNLITLHIGQNELVLVSPRGTRADSSPVPLEELDGMSLISTSSGTRSAALLEQLRRKGIRPRIVIEHPNREAVVPLILQGLGSSLMNRALASAAQAAGAEVFSFDPPQIYDVFLVHRSGRLTPAARAFIQQVSSLEQSEPRQPLLG